jgi:hypothetical protein
VRTTAFQNVAKLFVLLVCAGLCQASQAKIFRNAYISFELPPNWNCKLEGAEWVCENDYSKKQKEAIIILTAKEVGPSDSLAAYMSHLQTPRVLPDNKGVPSKSKVIRVTQRTIANQLWVDGMHEGSEVASYFTRYMATIKDRIAILVTFSAHKEHFSKYSNDFQQAIESLRVVATKDLLSDHLSGGSKQGGSETIGMQVDHNIPTMSDDGIAANTQGKKKMTGKFLLFALILGAAGIYLYLQSKKPRPRK